MIFAAEAFSIEAAEGKRPRIDILAYDGGIMTVPGFGPAVVDLAGMEMAASIQVIADHENKLNSVIGSGIASSRDGRLHLTGDMADGTDAAARTLALNNSGVKLQASIGAVPLARRHVRAGETVNVNGRRITASGNGFVLVTKSFLREVSVTPLGCDPGTSVQIAAKQEISMETSAFNEWLTAKTFDPEALSEGQKTFLQASYEAELKAATAPKTPEIEPKKPEIQPENDPIATLRASYAAETSRLAAIRKECGDKHLDIQAKAIMENWTVEKTALEVLRASYPATPAIHVADKSLTDDMLCAAICTQGKLAGIEKLYDDKTLQSAHDRFKGRFGLQKLLLEAAWSNGYTGRHFDEDMPGVFRAAFSTLSLPGIMANTANKFSLAAFMGVESVWREICTTRPVKDFKGITSYRMTGNFEHEELGPGGELKHGYVGEESYTNQAKTYGKMFSITRRDIINDDLGALTQIPAMLGRGAALKLNKVFWGAFMDNASFFSASNTPPNFDDGADSVLAIAGLTAAELMFLNQTDADGNPLSIDPAILLVPNALFVTATNLMSSLELRDTTSSTKYMTKNPHAGKFQVKKSSYLSNSGITGNSALKWYLLANPADGATIEVVFLNGVETPTVESADADFNTLGVQMRAFHDFGVAKQDYRFGVAFKGEV